MNPCWILEFRRTLPLDLKVQMSLRRIALWLFKFPESRIRQSTRVLPDDVLFSLVCRVTRVHESRLVRGKTEGPVIEPVILEAEPDLIPEWMLNGCNYADGFRSWPLSFWTRRDLELYMR